MSVVIFLVVLSIAKSPRTRSDNGERKNIKIPPIRFQFYFPRPSSAKMWHALERAVSDVTRWVRAACILKSSRQAPSLFIKGSSAWFFPRKKLKSCAVSAFILRWPLCVQRAVSTKASLARARRGGGVDPRRRRCRNRKGWAFLSQCAQAPPRRGARGQGSSRGKTRTAWPRKDALAAVVRKEEDFILFMMAEVLCFRFNASAVERNSNDSERQGQDRPEKHRLPDAAAFFLEVPLDTQNCAARCRFSLSFVHVRARAAVAWVWLIARRVAFWIWIFLSLTRIVLSLTALADFVLLLLLAAAVAQSASLSAVHGRGICNLNNGN